MLEGILVLHTCIHQPFKTITMPSVKLVAELIQVTLQEPCVDIMEHIKQFVYMQKYKEFLKIPNF